MKRLIALSTLLLSASCTTAPPGVHQMACPTLPASRPSKHPDPLPPVSDVTLIKRPGHWDWVDGNYVWEQPAWIAPPWRGASKWEDGFWTPNGGGCAWTPGHFIL